MHGEQPAPESGALAVNPLKLRGICKACALGPRQRSDSQTLAAPTAAGADDPPSTNRAHALAKTVSFGPFAAIWLVSALHRTPLRVLQNTNAMPKSISEAQEPIQLPHPQSSFL